MNTPPQQQTDYAPAVLLAGGYTLFFCLVSSIFFIFSTDYVSQLMATPVNVIATYLPPRTPHPGISLTAQADAETLFKDDFSDNQNFWTAGGWSGREKVEVVDGKLFLKPKIDDYYALALCSACPNMYEPYYLQADLATVRATDRDFGIVFNLKRYHHLFYLVAINTESKAYEIGCHTSDGYYDSWSWRLFGESKQIRSFPERNTIGVYVSMNVVEIYINGALVDSFNQADTSFQTGSYGFYVDDKGVDLMVDNLIITKAGGQ